MFILVLCFYVLPDCVTIWTFFWQEFYENMNQNSKESHDIKSYCFYVGEFDYNNVCLKQGVVALMKLMVAS